MDVPAQMSAVRLHAPGLDGLAVDTIDTPSPGEGEVLVRVHAAALTRDELDWVTSRLPAIPSYELSGTIAALGPGVSGLAVGDEVWALTDFDRDGVAAEYAPVAAALLAPKLQSLDHVESASIPLAGLSAWQGLFDHGRLRAGERVLIHGASGGVGQFATQLAKHHGAHVIGTASSAEGVADTLALGADEAIDRSAVRFEDAVEPVDLVYDTVGGDVLARSGAVLREGGRIVSVNEEPPKELINASYYIVTHNREQLAELGRLANEGALRPLVDAVFALAEARAAFERLAKPGKRGKVVLRIADD
jgi:NADPH:quinone reductase-like Zn-dependent oxidoreductase